MSSFDLKFGLGNSIESLDSYNNSGNNNASFSSHDTIHPPTLTTSSDGHARGHELYAAPSDGAVITIMCFSLLVFVSSCLGILLTHWTNAGQSATLIFLRSLYLSDLLMSIYAMAKMGLLLYLDQLRINFFLPDSLFFTATFASALSIVSLNVDCFIKLTRPRAYAQVDKDNVITAMLLVWNAAFIVGFLPLMGWNQDEDTVCFFDFYTWHYLLFVGCIVLACGTVCIASTVALRRFHTLSQFQPDCFSSGALEFSKYKQSHQTIVVESVMWICCYALFFMYVALTCSQCLLSDYAYRNSTVINFIPLFVVKALLSSVSQAVRTQRVHNFMSKFRIDTSKLGHFRNYIREKTCMGGEDGLPETSFSNPVCELQNRTSREMVHNQLVPKYTHMNLNRLSRVSELSSSSDFNDTLTGIANCSYRPSLDFGNVITTNLQNTTTL